MVTQNYVRNSSRQKISGGGEAAQIQNFLPPPSPAGMIKPFQARAVLGPIFQSAPRGVKTIFFVFFFIGASSIKRFAKSGILS